MRVLHSAHINSVCVYVRTVVRLVMFSQHSGEMMVRPLVTALDRSVLSQHTNTHQSPPSPSPSPSPNSPSPSPATSYSLTLKRSGRTIRRIEGAPPSTARDWSFPPSTLDHSQATSRENNSLQVGLSLHSQTRHSPDTR